jgi:cell division protein ZapE
MIDDIPIMGEEERNEAKRFMTLIDALYDNHVKVIATARAEPAQLYTATYGAEAFEFARTVSRLMEMRSKDYLARPHGRQDSQASDDITGLVET